MELVKKKRRALVFHVAVHYAFWLNRVPSKRYSKKSSRGLRAIKLFCVALIFIPVNPRFTQDLEKMVSPSGILKCKPPMVRAGACS